MPWSKESFLTVSRLWLAAQACSISLHLTFKLLSMQGRCSQALASAVSSNRGEQHRDIKNVLMGVTQVLPVTPMQGSEFFSFNKDLILFAAAIVLWSWFWRGNKEAVLRSSINPVVNICSSWKMYLSSFAYFCKTEASRDVVLKSWVYS